MISGFFCCRIWVQSTCLMGAGLSRILNYLSFTVTCLLGLVRSGKPDYLFVESPPLFLSVPISWPVAATRKTIISLPASR